MKSLIHIVSCMTLSLLCCNCSSEPDFTLKEGDLLFQDVDCGPFCNAIEAVTQGFDDYNFSHVGLVMKDAQGHLKVMEAVSAGVVLTPIDTFLSRSSDVHNAPKVLVGRVKPDFKDLIPGAIDFIQSKMTAAYDPYFDINNNQYYCSELIHLAFKHANGDMPIFKEYPMTFIAPDTQQTFAIWETYFNDLNYSIPEGQPGLNPGGMSRSPFIDMVYKYGEPTRSTP
ncbi:YiiX/YebB-like N1pC/P60 family cysteine hydrolase [Formosa algae]|uniref:YiiX/YebB-like N1pC/P60 family cysteine hydrolase n=1 Tax=Formosa algae TaxID=225843 RepID=UPI000CD2C674|nr:YiiX/YebB-like N1pC/P60 family cysteine hydrolase [Formosa algae]